MNGFDWKRPTVGLDATDGYKSPVTLYYQDQIMNVIQEETDNRIMGEIRMYVDVDKEELIKALNYDRQQYRKGWNDAVNKYVRFGKWIPVSERLPKELINPVTSDFYEYLCTIKIDNDYYVRTYKFGDMHWWHALRMMDEYVIAWMEFPEPYRGSDHE